MNETDSITATTDEQPHSVQMTSPRSLSKSSRADIRTRAVTPPDPLSPPSTQPGVALWLILLQAWVLGTMGGFSDIPSRH